MKIIYSIPEFRAERARLADQTLGFVPTMGALHSGHASLIERSVSESDVTVVSVYVNPTQFDNPDDLAKYPLMLDEDAALASSLGATLLFAPAYGEMYPDAFTYQIDETGFSRELCGAHRPGHFTGVLTVVMKLLNIVRPSCAYFGEKDYQQLQLIRGMVEAFFLEVDIVACPTVREPDGLAKSSRNLNLSALCRARAPLLYELISSTVCDDEIKDRLTAAGFDVDYVVSQFGRRFVAARTGSGPNRVRLIDNVALAGEVA